MLLATKQRNYHYLQSSISLGVMVSTLFSVRCGGSKHQIHERDRCCTVVVIFSPQNRHATLRRLVEQGQLVQSTILRGNGFRKNGGDRGVSDDFKQRVHGVDLNRHLGRDFRLGEVLIDANARSEVRGQQSKIQLS